MQFLAVSYQEEGIRKRAIHEQIRPMTQGLLDLDSSVGNWVHPYGLARAWTISRPSALLFRPLVIKASPSPFSYAKKKATNPAFIPGCQKYRFGPLPSTKNPSA